MLITRWSKNVEFNDNIDKQAFTDSINEQAVNFKAQFEFLSDPRQRRRRCPFLKKIVEMTRANSTLYNKAIERLLLAHKTKL